MARFQNIDSLSDVGNFENIAFTDNLRIECSLAGAWVSSLLWCIILALMVKVGTLATTQVPKTSVNLDGDVREKFMCPPSILIQGSWEWGVSQISTGRILHSGLNFR